MRRARYSPPASPEAALLEAQELYEKNKRTFPFPRFWRLVKRGNENECWLWQGSVNSTGYGTSPVQLLWTSKANRIVLMIKLKRDLLPGMGALHTCDVRSCCNPAHLYEGTPKQNRADMTARGRSKNCGFASPKHPWHGKNKYTISVNDNAPPIASTEAA